MSLVSLYDSLSAAQPSGGSISGRGTVSGKSAAANPAEGVIKSILDSHSGSILRQRIDLAAANLGAEATMLKSLLEKAGVDAVSAEQFSLQFVQSALVNSIQAGRAR